MKKILLSILLVAVILALAWWLVSIFRTPLEFERQRKEREVYVIDRLKDIRTAQRAYRAKYQKFTPSLDELIAFVEKDSMVYERSIGSADDSVAVARGLVRTERFRMAVKDTISFLSVPMDKVDDLRYIPFSEMATGELKQFKMDTTSIETESKVVVPVVEVMAPYADWLGDLDKQELINYRHYRVKTLGRDDGLKVGSLIATTNEAGNWE